MKRFLTILFIFFAATFFAQENAVKKAPEFELEDINGDEAALSDYLGEGPVLISFWATWCKPCVEEMKHYEQLYKKYESRGLKVIAISEDNERSTAKVIPFIRSNQYTFDVLLDPDNSVARDYYVRVVPHTYVLDKEGKIVYSHSGYKRGDELLVEKKIKELLGEK